MDLSILESVGICLLIEQKIGFGAATRAGHSPHDAGRNTLAGLVLLHLGPARGAARPALGAACCYK
ncbi:hypothetical protein A2U01_0095766, partial [Trifolium medium]|nr:hypothetical protein [Trifolium medium]